jgi:hypothetical protein
MSVVLVGKAPAANILVTDAMATMKADTTSFRDCRLKDKIRMLSASNSYCGILGDENVLFGIQAIDDWSFNKAITLDFSDQATMNNALIAAEKYIQVYKMNGDKQLPTNGASVYFITNDMVFEYNILRTNDKYCIHDFRHFENNEVILNYGGAIKKVFIETTLDNYISKSIELINEEHENRKLQSIKNNKRISLKYDFDNRFCGVVLAVDEEPQILLPFRYLNDLFASEINNWDLMTDKSFVWSPF